MERVYLGLDVGSVSTNLVLIDENEEVKDKIYIRTKGQPMSAIHLGLNKLQEKWQNKLSIKGVGTTGSGRQLAGILVGADIIKNEITAHAVAASNVVQEARTVIEIGGQDSKLIILRNGLVADFAMNTVCAAGTGSFLDQQAQRLGLAIGDFGSLALKAKTPVRIAGRCTVFAESDMIHKQQAGHSLEEIIAGLAEALVRNFLNNLGRGKKIQGPVVFQGGVAANIGIKQAFERALNTEVVVPENYDVMGAIGMAILAKEEAQSGRETKFKGFQCISKNDEQAGFECQECPNNCEIVQVIQGQQIIASWGDRCGKWFGQIKIIDVETGA